MSARLPDRSSPQRYKLYGDGSIRDEVTGVVVHHAPEPSAEARKPDWIVILVCGVMLGVFLGEALRQMGAWS